MRALLILLAALAVGCGSAPPAGPAPPREPHSEGMPEEPALPDSALVAAAPEPCAPDAPARPFLRPAYGWIPEVAPLLGCAVGSLDDPAWGLTTAQVRPAAGRAEFRFAPPEASGVALVVGTDEGRIERLTLTVEPEDPRRVAQLFRNEAAGIGEYLLLSPLAEDARRRIYPPAADRPYAIGLYRTDRTVSVQVASGVADLREPTPPPEASPGPETCSLGAVANAEALFDPTPTTWVPVAPRLLGCSREAVAALPLGAADTTRSTPEARIETYARRGTGSRWLLVVVYGEDGTVAGASVTEEVPERIAETIFELRSEQVREVVRGEPAASPPGTLVFPASGARSYGVRLALSPPFLVLSVVRE